MAHRPPRISLDAVRRLWFHRQGLSAPRTQALGRDAFVDHLERTGGLQLDSINVLARAHYLTLWSRFGAYDMTLPDTWTHTDRVAFEHWGHAACVLPASRLPLSRRAMRRFAPTGKWWSERRPSSAACGRVMKRLRDEGPLESADFGQRGDETGPWWGWKEDKEVLERYWHKGRIAISARRSFRRVYDVAERVYPEGPIASPTDYEDSWLLTGLRGNGVAHVRHIDGYFRAPHLSGDARRKSIARLLKRREVVEVEVEGQADRWLARPGDLEDLDALPAPRGTTLLCPFDSLLWQRRRAEDLLGFTYRVEIYVPKKDRVYGYYAMPILHCGRLVGRLDPKLHRDRGVLEIKSVHLEPGIPDSAGLRRGLEETLEDLATFVGATDLQVPRPPWATAGRGR
jgi:uncharacterized protein